jgi:hypothetical protein
MQFYCSLGLAEACPVEHAQAQINDGGVQAQELILETQFFLGCQALGQGQLIVKQMFEQLPGAPGIGVGQGRTLRTFFEPQMIELAFTTG